MEIWGIIKELMVGGILFLLVAAVLTPYFRPANQGNNLCENKFTAAYYGSGREDHEETKADGNDCCFLRDWETNQFEIESSNSAKEWCLELVNVCENSEDCELGDVTEANCDEVPSKNRAYFLFDCTESTMSCDSESCVMNCNYDGVCESGEYSLCPDCY